MALDQYRLRLRKNKPGHSETMPDYSLSYKTGALGPVEAGYSILSALAGNNDVIIELNTDLFSDISSSMDRAAAFESAIRVRGLAYSRKEVQSDRRARYFGIPIEGKKKSKALKIAAYIPNPVWKEESFRSVLPACGGRYYILKQPMDAGAVVNDIWNISDEEQEQIFRMVVFYIADFGQMGITSGSADEQELKGLLGLR